MWFVDENSSPLLGNSWNFYDQCNDDHILTDTQSKLIHANQSTDKNLLLLQLQHVSSSLDFIAMNLCVDHKSYYSELLKVEKQICINIIIAVVICCFKCLDA